MFQVAQITAVDPVSNMVQLKFQKSGITTSFQVPAMTGGSGGQIQYIPVENDLVFVDSSDGVHFYITGSVTNPTDVLPRTKLDQGEWALFNSAGAMVKLNNDGSITLVAGGSNPVVYLGNVPLGKAVALDGDTATGVDSHGDTVTVTIQASSVNVKAS